MFFQKAKEGRNDWYYYVVTIFLGFFLSFIFGIPHLIWRYANDQFEIDRAKTPQFLLYLFDKYSSFFAKIQDKNMVFVIVCLSFLGLFLGLLIGIKYLNRKKISSVLTGTNRFRWGRVFFSFCMTFLFYGILVFSLYKISPEEFIVQFDATKFAILVLLSIVFLGIQATTEEILVRGYFTQAFGLLSNSRLVALILPTIIFAALHMGNPEVAEHGWVKMFPAYAGMGLIFAIMTLMDDGTELAIGSHIGNNIAIALLVSSPEAVLQTYAILRLKEVQEPEGTLVQILIFGVIFISIFAIRYRWKDWSKLWGRIY